MLITPKTILIPSIVGLLVLAPQLPFGRFAMADVYTAEALAEAAPADDVAPAIANLLSDEGIRVVKDGKRTVCEIWPLREVATLDGVATDDERLYPFEVGQLLGVMRLRRRGSDFRDQDISRGVYTMRYALQPVDGNHVGTSPTRDFLLLVKAADDQSPAAMKPGPLNEASAEAAGSTPPGHVVPATSSRRCSNGGGTQERRQGLVGPANGVTSEGWRPAVSDRLDRCWARRRMSRSRHLAKKVIATCCVAVSVAAFAANSAHGAPPGNAIAPTAIAPVAERAADGQSAESKSTNAASSPSFKVESVRGKVVWYAKALDRLLGIKATSDANRNTLAIETGDGHLHPLIDDLRARAFRKDERLQQMEVELLVRRYEVTPSLQVLKMFQVEGGERYQLDYWCDICAIVMFERGACACCQDDNRLRKRLIESP